MGRLHGYAIARRNEQVGRVSLQLSQGSIYPALIRLEQERWIAADWGILLPGFAVGLVGAVAVTRITTSLLFEVSPLDPVALATACLSLAAIGLLAGFLPANRAVHIDPAVTLRDIG